MRPICICRSSPGATSPCSMACSPISTGAAQSTRALSSSIRAAWPRRMLAANSGRCRRGGGLTDWMQASIATFYDLFARHPKTVTAFSMGVNQSAVGHRQGQCHHQLPSAHGPHRQRGRGPFSITGQPNAMGGREVGGLANMLAAHMDIENADASRRGAGVLAVADHRREAGPQGRRTVRGRASRARSRPCGSWPPIRR